MSDPIYVCVWSMANGCQPLVYGSIVIPYDLHGRVGGAKPDVTIRVWIQSTKDVVFGGTVARCPGSLAKGDKGCSLAKLLLLLAEYLIFS